MFLQLTELTELNRTIDRNEMKFFSPGLDDNSPGFPLMIFHLCFHCLPFTFALHLLLLLVLYRFLLYSLVKTKLRLQLNICSLVVKYAICYE